jgi:hypothetical protein
MRVAVDTAAADTAASAGADAHTVEPESAKEPVHMPRDLIHLESQRDSMAAPHRESRLEGRFIVLARGRKVERLPSSLLVRHAIRVAITFRKINPGLVLRVSLLSSRVTMREKIGIYASSARPRLQKVQPGPAVLGLDRI